MILTGPEIEQAVRDGRIHIDPYEQSQVNPASYDLTLGDTYRTYDHVTWGTYRWFDPKDPRTIRTRMETINEFGVTLKPGVGYLMHTRAPRG